MFILKEDADRIFCSHEGFFFYITPTECYMSQMRIDGFWRIQADDDIDVLMSIREKAYMCFTSRRNLIGVFTMELADAQIRGVIARELNKGKMRQIRHNDWTTIYIYDGRITLSSRTNDYLEVFQAEIPPTPHMECLYEEEPPIAGLVINRIFLTNDADFVIKVGRENPERIVLRKVADPDRVLAELLEKN